ncbi:prephenate dehydratase [Candidatus Kinetoplastibacterium desouzaii TCC079E]|uniref:Bifunctional chorismate mutase/prephenate dehydratase n=1 Tax=Candidatus Kinetoplastidibacterium desouzai TCC079E TaxID=1208919 RepID=M1M420_9PROT|nr:prephenate dehydratase [Candidatus Kinetoplastibacterium desouzaii]AGF46980.1 prephenate dehydratase [Candidatus Kinetoplastibacterium desouzaii TCC079E]
MDDELYSKLLPLRNLIDELDRKILETLNRRSEIVVEIGKIKHSVNLDDSVIKPERESQIIEKLQRINTGPFQTSAIEHVWKEIISACRDLERSMQVAYLGPKGSFSEQAAFEHFGRSVNNVQCTSFDEVFHAIESGRADVGMVPIENSIEGAVNRSLDLFLNSNLKIIGERSLIIKHCLLTKSGNMNGIKKITAHPQALAQCQEWLNKHYPNLERVSTSSNSEAAHIASKSEDFAAIAGMIAAESWGLRPVYSNIQDDINNRTRFLAIGNIESSPSGNDKTSLILAVPNKACAVYEMLKPFAIHKVSMTRFESRPARTGQWEYYFYVDIIGHQKETNVSRALELIKTQVAFFKNLGSYPAQ